MAKVLAGLERSSTGTRTPRAGASCAVVAREGHNSGVRVSSSRTLAAFLIASFVLGGGASSSAATSVAPAPACAPSTLGTSAALAGGAVTVSPAPEAMDASHLSQISFLGVPAAEIADVEVVGSRSGPHAGRLAAYSQGDGASFLPSHALGPGRARQRAGGVCARRQHHALRLAFHHRRGRRDQPLARDATTAATTTEQG